MRSTRSPTRSPLVQPRPGAAPGDCVVSVPLAGSAVAIGSGRRTGRPPGSMLRRWTYWPARAPDTTPGACQAWSHVPGTISRRSTSSAPALRIAGRGPENGLAPGGGPSGAAVRRLVLVRLVGGVVGRLALAVGLEIRGDRRERLGEGVGKVAEHVRRVVELHQL